MKKIVTIGGGSGLSTLLRGLRDYPAEITAIVTMTDDGASTGRLRRDLKILPPGDIRKCLAALSEDESLLIDLFQYRFNKGLGLSGHSLGNLLISALKDMTGSFEMAVEGISRLLSINGKVLPASLTDVHLTAEFEDGRRITGESKITQYGYKKKIKKIDLTKKIKANPKAIAAISDADLILIGPGSLYTSILPNFLVDEIRKANQDSNAVRVYIANVSTERGETDSFSLEDHLRELEEYGSTFDYVLANSKTFPEKSGDGFVSPVRVHNQGDRRYVFADLIHEEDPLLHDSEKLGQAVWRIVLDLKKHQKAKEKLYSK